MHISVSKNNEVLRGGASRANRGYVLAHCGGGGVTGLIGNNVSKLFQDKK